MHKLLPTAYRLFLRFTVFFFFFAVRFFFAIDPLLVVDHDDNLAKV
ncbi:MAG: hypothetical protein HYV03_07455 [Deltaproteobacteria bacterium]|nr:hypothetical protein [Deltaproteobacteria bacterium]